MVHEPIESFKIDTQQSEPLLKKLERDGIISNDELRKLFESVSASSYSKGELSVIERMTNGNPVGKFRPFVCPICHTTMKGAMIEHESEIGRKILQAIGPGAAHYKCNIGFGSNVGY